MLSICVYALYGVLKGETANVKKHNSATFGAKVIGLQHESGAFA